jgi:hypothetical protein
MSISTLVARKASRERGLLLTSGNDPQKTMSDALALVAGYVPTEILTLYTMVLGIVTASGTHLPLWVFLAFLAFTPPVVWLVYAVREREEGRTRLPWRPSEWPLWEMCAALIAFVVWSAVMPRGALEVYPWYRADLAAIALLMVSLFLPLIGRLAKK